MRRVVCLLAASVLASTAAAFAGCSYDWTYVGPAGGSADGGGKDAEPLPAKDASDPPLVPPPAVGCKASDGCGTEAYCAFESGDCGRSGFGKCIPVSSCADRPPGDGCSCDGIPTKTACDAAKRGFDMDLKGGCANPDGFTCGSTTCTRSKQYCLKKGSPPSTGCADLPACGAKCTCADVTPVPGCVCDATDPTAFNVSCD